MDDTLAGERLLEVDLCPSAICLDGLVVEEPATESDLRAVQVAHALRVGVVERRVPQLTVEREDRLVVRVDDRLQGFAIGRHRHLPLMAMMSARDASVKGGVLSAMPLGSREVC